MEELFKLETITTIPSIITALGVIVATTKKGRLWFIKPALDSINRLRNDEAQHCAETDNRLKSIKRSSLRTELLLLMNDPKSPEKDVYDTYEEYERMGGNHYIHDRFIKWKKSNNKRGNK